MHCQNQESIAEVNRILTDYNCEGVEIPKTSPDLKNTFVIYPLQNIPDNLLEHEFIGIRADELNLLIQPEWQCLISKMVILQPVTFKTEEEYELHKLLRAIAGNTLITKLSNNDYCKSNETFINKRTLLEKYQYYPQIIKNTQYIVEASSFEFDFKTPKTKTFY